MELKRKIGAHVIVLLVRDDLGPMAEDLLDTLEKLDAKGPALREGTRIAYGWTTLTLAEGYESEPSLDIREPDLDSEDPLQITLAGADETLDVILQQGSVCKLVDVEAVASWYMHDVRLAPGVLDEDAVYLHRQRPTSDHDTGWYIGSVANQNGVRPEDVETMPVWQVFQRRRALLQVMALPIEYLAIVKYTYVDAILDPSNKEIYRRR